MNTPVPWPAGGLYAIADGAHDELLAACEAALEGGTRVLQYRPAPGLPATRQRADARALKHLCDRHRTPLLVANDVPLAAAIGAAGVHFETEAPDLAAARQALGPSAVLGVSCRDSLQRARRFAAEGADYLSFGVFFASPTLPQAALAPPELLTDARALGKPLVAIGGITPARAPRLRAAGADFIAVVSGLFASADVRAAAKAYAAAFSPA